MKRGILLTLGLTGLLFANEKNDVAKRLDASNMVLKEIFETPDKGIPQDLMDKAHCAVVIPNLKQAGFILGGKYGKGFATCRKPGGGWGAPAAIRVEGGSIGLQIGAGETDVVMLVMNESGAKHLISSEFKIGGEAQAMAGPVGRTAQAATDATMHAEILGWSRSRGVFAGLALEGSTVREDKDDNQALYGNRYSNEEILNTVHPAVPSNARPLIATLSMKSHWEK